MFEHVYCRTLDVMGMGLREGSAVDQLLHRGDKLAEFATGPPTEVVGEHRGGRANREPYLGKAPGRAQPAGRQMQSPPLITRDQTAVGLAVEDAPGQDHRERTLVGIPRNREITKPDVDAHVTLEKPRAGVQVLVGRAVALECTHERPAHPGTETVQLPRAPIGADHGPSANSPAAPPPPLARGTLAGATLVRGRGVGVNSASGEPAMVVVREGVAVDAVIVAVDVRGPVVRRGLNTVAGAGF